MDRRGTLAVVLGAVGVAGTALVLRRRALAVHPPEVVGHVDLPRYMGRWYEIARNPTRFQGPDCINATATYSLREDGTVEVVNECARPEGCCGKVAHGVARVVDPATNAKLKVSFFRPFTGDYWIVDLDADYRYAVVSEPRRRYLWILSREPEMDPETYADIIERLSIRGFDTNRLVQRRG